MFRVFLTYFLPLVGPLFLYLAWNAYARAAAKRSGGEPPSLEKGPIFWSIVAGFVLMSALLITLAMTGGHKAGDAYFAPRFEDGKIIPPHFEKRPKP